MTFSQPKATEEFPSVSITLPLSLYTVLEPGPTSHGYNPELPVKLPSMAWNWEALPDTIRL